MHGATNADTQFIHAWRKKRTHTTTTHARTHPQRQVCLNDFFAVGIVMIHFVNRTIQLHISPPKKYSTQIPPLHDPLSYDRGGNCISLTPVPYHISPSLLLRTWACAGFNPPDPYAGGGRCMPGMYGPASTSLMPPGNTSVTGLAYATLPLYCALLFDSDLAVMSFINGPACSS